jgi:hypothetical protein
MRPAELTKRYVALRQDKADLKAQIRDIEDEMEQIAKDFIQHFEENECQRATFAGHTVYMNKSTVPSVKDWEAFWKYVVKQRADHLIEHRPSVTGCRELFETKGKIPGLEPFERTTIGVRKS